MQFSRNNDWEYAHELARITRSLPLDTIKCLVNWHRDALPARLSKERHYTNVAFEIWGQFCKMVAIRNANSTTK
jgi:hypothetical protein